VVDPFRFAIALTADAESLDLLRELSGQVARAAGLDDGGARRAGTELVDAIAQRTRGGAGPAPVVVSFERREPDGPVDVEVTGGALGSAGPDERPAASTGPAAEVRRSWSAR
jgi:hypothetical protein